MLKWAFNPALRPAVLINTEDVVLEDTNYNAVVVNVEIVPEKEEVKKVQKKRVSRSNTGTITGRLRVSSFLGSLTGINESMRKRWNKKNQLIFC